MDDNELKARVARALERRSLEARRLKTFYFDMAEAADSSVSSIKNWMRQDCVPEAAALLNLFDNVPGFEAEVRGTTEAPPLDSAKATAHLKAALEALGVRDDATVIAADFAQRTGLK